MHVEEQLYNGRTVFTTAGPKEMFGTKWPSMMSRCSQSAPDLFHAHGLARQTAQNWRPGATAQ